MSANDEPRTAPPLAAPLPTPRSRSDADRLAHGVQSPTDQLGPDSAQVLYTPAQAAELLQVRESWLRRRAARRQVPCTFLGKHLRFSRANLDQIVTDATVPTTTALRRTPGRRASPDRQVRPRRRTN
ncbi:helix-turn-helix domain-containing protein [Amycolatopsis thermoflava]|uniref:helix-turn-helix domain-containing protein n=1 Tax=Amycolatopsis thermoflava TaxID=84480 RepID=UPI00381BE277